MFPAECVVSVSVYHLPTTGGSIQSYPGTADATIQAAFLPLDRREHAYEGLAFQDPYELYAEHSADLRVGDKLVISGTTYFIKKIFNAPFGGLPHKRCTISTQAT